MATQRRPNSRGRLIHCENCGEDYSATYRRCPFCDEYAYDYEEDERTSRSQNGGKRLANAARESDGGVWLHTVAIIISLAIIIAAVWIVVTKLMPLVQRGDIDTVDAENAATAPPPSFEPTTPPAPTPGIGEGEPDESTTSPAPNTPTTAPTPTAPPALSGEATGFSLSSEDVSLYSKGEVWRPRVTFTPEGTTATVIWESDNPNIASVTTDGQVTAVSPGITTISAMLPNGVTHSAIVRCRWSGDSAPSPSPTSNGGSSSSNYTVNNPDFTFERAGETYRLQVPGYSGTVTWSSSDTSLVTVSSDGTCTAVGRGSWRKCVVTGTLEDGSTVSADVYINIE